MTPRTLPDPVPLVLPDVPDAGENSLTPDDLTRALLGALHHERLTATTAVQSVLCGQGLTLSVQAVARALRELHRRQLVVYSAHGLRALWSLPEVPDASLVRSEWNGLLTGHLEGRRELCGTVARALNLPLPETRATLETLRRAGLISGTPVGHTMLYSSEARLRTWTDQQRAAQVQATPYAQLQAYLRSLPAEHPVKRAPSAMTLRERAGRATPARRAATRRTPAARRAAPGRRKQTRAAELRHLEKQLRAEARQHSSGRANANVRRLRQTRLSETKRQQRQDQIKAGHELRTQAAARTQPATPPGLPPGALSDRDAATLLGVDCRSLNIWLARHPEWRHDSPMVGQTRAVGADTRAAFLAGASRARQDVNPQRPDDTRAHWLDFRQVVARYCWNTAGIYKAYHAGRITGAPLNGKLYFDPVSIEQLIREDARELRTAEARVLQDNLATVTDIALRAGGLSKSTVADWMTRHGVKGVTLPGSDGQRHLCYPEAQSDAFQTALKADAQAVLDTERRVLAGEIIGTEQLAASASNTNRHGVTRWFKQRGVTPEPLLCRDGQRRNFCSAAMAAEYLAGRQDTEDERRRAQRRVQEEALVCVKTLAAERGDTKSGNAAVWLRKHGAALVRLLGPNGRYRTYCGTGDAEHFRQHQKNRTTATAAGRTEARIAAPQPR